MSPRKSSTSSGRPGRPRARYLGIEVAGEPFPSFSPSRWVALLQERLNAAGLPHLGFRLIRSEGGRAVVRVTQATLEAALRAWNDRPGLPGRLRSRRTWGTLVKAKAWLAATEETGPTPGDAGREASRG